MAFAFIAFFSQLGYFELSRGTALVVAGSALAATIAESLPISDVLDDNLTVPVVAAAASAALLSRV